MKNVALPEVVMGEALFPWSPGARFEWRRLGWLLLSLAIVAADRISKLLVLDNFSLYERLQLTPFFDLTLTYNTGAAFSFLANAGGWQQYFFVVVSVIAVLAFIWLLLRSAQPLFCVAAALIIGGALGNMWDRLEIGKVVDFLLLHYKDWYYPAFNVADSAIVLGALLLIADGLRQKKNQIQGEAR